MPGIAANNSLASSTTMGRVNSMCTDAACDMYTGTRTHVADIWISGACRIFWDSCRIFCSSKV